MFVTRLLPIDSLSFSSLQWKIGAVTSPPDRRYHDNCGFLLTQGSSSSSSRLRCVISSFYYSDIPAVIFFFFFCMIKMDGRPLPFWIHTKWDPSDKSLKAVHNDLFILWVPPHPWSFSSPPQSRNNKHTRNAQPHWNWSMGPLHLMVLWLFYLYKGTFIECVKWDTQNLKHFEYAEPFRLHF